MTNKGMIKKLKDNAELAWAAYGYYDLMTNDTSQAFIVLKDKEGKDRIDSSGNSIVKQITFADIMDNTYKNYEAYHLNPKIKKKEKIGKLKGDFTPTQAKNFFDKYDLLDFYPKFDAKNNKQLKGFHAALFQDKQSKEYTLAIRGSFDLDDYMTDFISLLKDSKIPFDYLHTMCKLKDKII
ncbi:hypothetical protein [Campylobacter helveticus]|uniref:hypothetical protein n=1 Tax=Campylobacter helveticus TaxID=28898 RepID=UPI00197ADEDD|nr:hypothetical protein [Campylobacter helveticus]